MGKLRLHQTIGIKVLFVMILIVFISGSTGWIVNAQNGSGDDGNQSSDKTQIQTTRFDQEERVRVIVQLDVPYQNSIDDQMSPMVKDAQSELTQSLKSYNVRLIYQYQYIPFVAMEVDRSGFEELLKFPGVVSVEEDKENFPFLLDSVPLIKADQVWSAGYTGAGQVVAILDTGVDKTHPALAGKVVSEACYSSEGTSLCPGGVATSIATNSGLPCAYTGCDHGTHVAGIVAANGASGTGVAKDSNIIAVQVFHLTIYSQLSASDADIASALERVYALRNTYDISAVNLSLGTSDVYSTSCDAGNSLIKTSIDKLRSVGIATVIASGNGYKSTGISSPACISTAVSIGATTKSNTVAAYSNSAQILDLLAPGSSIFSTVPGTGYASKDGTSMATPHVAGAWALLKSAKPDATVTEVLEAFKDTGVLITDTRNSIVKPRINVFAALQEILNPTIKYEIFLPLLNRNYKAINDPIKNGDFEKGADGSWAEFSNNGWDLINNSGFPGSVLSHSGSWLTWLGGDYNDISRVSQSIAIPSGAPYLHLWYWIGSEDICDFDHFRVKINSVEIFQTTLCSSKNTSGWVEKAINLESYAGTTVNLMFEVITDEDLNSNLFLDDVSLSYVSTTSVAGVETMQLLGDVTTRKEN